MPRAAASNSGGWTAGLPFDLRDSIRENSTSADRKCLFGAVLVVVVVAEVVATRRVVTAVVIVDEHGGSWLLVPSKAQNLVLFVNFSSPVSSFVGIIVPPFPSLVFNCCHCKILVALPWVVISYFCCGSLLPLRLAYLCLGYLSVLF